MPDLIQLASLPGAGRRAPAAPEPKGLPLLRLGFRPFYLGAAIAAVACICLWLAVLRAAVPLPAGAAPLLWHAHEMLFGFAAAVIVGFLFTAGKAWTGLSTPRGAPLAALWLLWLAGRVVSVSGPPILFALVDGAFLLLAALVFLRLILRARNWRNLPVVAILLLLAAANAAFHLGALGLLPLAPMQALLAALSLVLLLACLIGGRVIPAFTRSATPGLRIRDPRWLGTAAVAFTALGLLLWIADAPAAPTAALLGLAALLQAARMAGWGAYATWRRPILWILHLSYAWIPVGLALLAAAEYGWIPASAGVHALAVGCIGGLIIGMMTRTARGHTGRTLQASPLEVTAYVLVMAAALLRVGVALLPPAYQGDALLSAGLAWAAAFALYLCRFAGWLGSARLDGKDG